MRKEMLFVLLIFLIAGAVAMDDSITVKTSPNDYVKIYAWTAGGGPLLSMNQGVAENGTFTTTFFSLIEPKVRFQIIVLKNNEKIRDQKFENQGITEPLLIDCVPEVCSISTFNEDEITIKEINEEDEENISDEENVLGENSTKGITAKSIREYIPEKLNLWIAVVFFIFIFLVILFLFLRKKKRDRDDEELEKLEEQIKEKEEELKIIKEKEMKKKKIEEAKRKLAEEEKELQEARRLKKLKIEEAKRKLAEEENEIEEMKKSESDSKNNKNSAKSFDGYSN